VQHAASRPHWRETYVGTVIGDRVLEGFIDLIYRDDGLVIIDHKTDTVPAVALGQRVAFYRPRWPHTQLLSRRHTRTGHTLYAPLLVPRRRCRPDRRAIKEAAALIRDAVRSG
jgi:ATP-dependent helicase/nuclease subunit A